MNTRKKKIRYFLLVFLLLLGVMALSAFKGGKGFWLERALGSAASGFQRMSAGISNYADQYFSKFAKYGRTQQENAALQKEIDSLREKVIDYDRLKQENERLRNLSGMREAHPDYQFAGGTVIGREPEEQGRTFTIDCGTAQGVSIHDPVMTEHGLVGWVEKTGPAYSVVSTILSPKLKVGAYDTATGQLGVVLGDTEAAQNGNCAFTYLEQEPETGSLVVTTGTSGTYPRDMVIGTIEKSMRQGSGTSYMAVIKPANDIMELRHVVVLTGFLGQGEGSDSP